MAAHADLDGALSTVLADVREAITNGDWPRAQRLSQAALLIDPGNVQAEAFSRTAAAMLGASPAPGQPTGPGPAARPAQGVPRYEPPSPARASTPRPAQQGSAPTERAEVMPASHQHSHDLDEVAKAVAEFQPFSPVASELLAKLDDEFSTIEDVAQLAATDQALTARILRAANSAFYQRRMRASTVRDALVILGARELRSLIIASCLVESSPQTTCIDRQAFWRFSLVTGLLAEMYARTRGALSGESFTAGVMHNVGALALDLYCPEGLREVLLIDQPGLRRLSDRERAIFGFTDAELAARLVDQWRLPRDVIRAVQSYGDRRDEVNAAHTPSMAIVTARVFARSQGLHDGLEQSEARPIPEEWGSAPLEAAITRAGGWERLLERIDAFMGQMGDA